MKSVYDSVVGGVPLGLCYLLWSWPMQHLDHVRLRGKDQRSLDIPLFLRLRIMDVPREQLLWLSRSNRARASRDDTRFDDMRYPEIPDTRDDIEMRYKCGSKVRRLVRRTSKKKYKSSLTEI